MRLAAAQIQSQTGNIEHNLEKHLACIKAASSLEADLILFPELSLTGYEPKLAKALATKANNNRWDNLQHLSDAHQMIIGVGLPLNTDTGIHIGMAIFQPLQERLTYAKRYLHADESPYFSSGQEQVILHSHNLTLAPAICYESLLPEHAAQAAQSNANVYLASVAKPQHGVEKAHTHYPFTAKKHAMVVLMSNGIGPSDDFISSGQSAAWKNDGSLAGQLNSTHEGLLLFDTKTQETKTLQL